MEIKIKQDDRPVVMTFGVITSLAAYDKATAALLPGAILCRKAYDRVYRICQIGARIDPVEYRDIDGELLVSGRSFDSIEAAKAWVDRDAAQRAALLSSRLNGITS